MEKVKQKTGRVREPSVGYRQRDQQEQRPWGGSVHGKPGPQEGRGVDHGSGPGRESGAEVGAGGRS